MNSYRKIHRWTALVVFLLATVVYLMTMAPTLSFWDCGEFIAASHTMSVPHPPGAPFYLLLGRFFSLLPIGSDIGFRVNLISVFSSALTVMFLYLVIVQLIRIMRGVEQEARDYVIAISAGVVGALTYAFSHSFWFNAVEAEVYAISMFFTAIVIWLIFAWREHSDSAAGDRYLLLIFYIIGLAIGVHLLNVLALPAVFLVVYYRKYPAENALRVLTAWVVSALLILPIYPGIVQKLPTLAASYGLWVVGLIVLLLVAVYIWSVRKQHHIGALASAALLLVMIGYFSYAIILIRSGLNPPLDENNPETFTKLVAYLNREQYGVTGLWSSFWPRNAPLWDYQINYMYIRYFLQNFMDLPRYYALPLLLGFFGAAHHFSKDWKHASVVLNLFLLTGLAIIAYVNQNDPQPRERDYSYVGSFFAFAIWIGIGTQAVLEWVSDLYREKRRSLNAIAVTGVLLLILLPVNMMARNYHTHSRSGNYVAWDYAWNMLNSMEPDAIVFTNGDNDTFPLWYLQYVEHVREDVRVINLSLLNTGWYIRQLRDEEPKVAVSLNDDFIDSYVDSHDLEALRWRYLPGPSPISLRTTRGDSMEFTVTPTMRLPVGDGSTGNNFLQVKDLLILDILHTNFWRKPVYFAVTVSRSNQVGLGDAGYLRMDGLVFRVVQEALANENDIDTEVLAHNLLEVYPDHFRNLSNPAVYLNDDIKRMMQNYRSAYLQLAMAYMYSDRHEEGLEVLRQLELYLPEERFPTFSQELALQIGQMYWQMGDSIELERRLETFLDRDCSQDDLLLAAQYYIEFLNDPAGAAAILRRLPATPTILTAIGEAWLGSNQPDSAVYYYKESLKLS
ncbi:MAG: DUF2723 domain-containing protein, partial [Candidatus Delongbacteria bacterium]|nr:DUF2723 domain-containing protein [Candidatus Delongbacteria bacterium]